MCDHESLAATSGVTETLKRVLHELSVAIAERILLIAILPPRLVFLGTNKYACLRNICDVLIFIGDIRWLALRTAFGLNVITLDDFTVYEFDVLALLKHAD